ncbi:hypothetical protein GCM10010393_47940 [Streptomyces gobitricini]|uniref:Uncharacterized protein n=1 Tax=Streptomyces gobitricini TaxID=68211 RepID=A0ABP6A6Y3_9ACTN
MPHPVSGAASAYFWAAVESPAIHTVRVRGFAAAAPAPAGTSGSAAARTATVRLRLRDIRDLSYEGETGQPSAVGVRP